MIAPSRERLGRTVRNPNLLEDLSAGDYPRWPATRPLCESTLEQYCSSSHIPDAHLLDSANGSYHCAARSGHFVRYI
jgi:hypothetical protein